MTKIAGAASERLELATIARSLQARLDAAFAGIERRHAVVAMSVDGECHYAMASACPVRCIADAAFSTGCLTKLFTAALIERALEAHELTRDTPVQELLRPSPPALRGTTVGQLVDHTHGLERYPEPGSGSVDLESLQRQTARLVRQAAPGEMYSYSGLGARVAAAVLEGMTAQGFGELLASRLLAPLGIRLLIQSRSLAPGPEVCPSIGGRLAVSAGDMLRFLTDWALPRARCWPGTTAGTIELPGWHALERGIYRGWKFYGAGWYGHNSIWPAASASVRILPRARVALLVTSAVQPVTAIAAKLFCRVLPEYRNLHMPKPLALREPPERLCSRYGLGESVAIEQRRARLWLEGPDFANALEPAEHNILFSRPPKLPRYAFVQPLRPSRRGYEYLWNGQRVLRRTTP